LKVIPPPFKSGIAINEGRYYIIWHLLSLTKTSRSKVNIGYQFIQLLLHLWQYQLSVCLTCMPVTVTLYSSLLYDSYVVLTVVTPHLV